MAVLSSPAPIEVPNLRRARPVQTVERLAVAEEQASLVRHDVRNKLGSVRNAAFYIERKLQRDGLLQDDARTQDFLKLIAAELDRANELLNDGFTFASLHLAAVREESLSGAIARVVDDLPAVFRRRVGVHLEGSPRIQADAAELELMLSCVIDNALEASPLARVRVHLGRVADTATVTIEDDGPGLPGTPRDAMRPFGSTKVGHEGIGLNIARRVARRYGGALDLGTTLAGVRVVITFPLTREQE